MIQVKIKKLKGKNGEAARVNFQGDRLGFSSLLLPFYFCLFTFYFLLTPLGASAQDDPPELAPPPLKVISREERQRLDAKSDLKDRTKLALELMNARIAAAEKLNAGQDFDGTFRELGGFHGLMDNSLEFLQKRDSGSGKVLDNFKRIDIALRGFGPRLEAIRREMPPRYEEYVRKLGKYVREARTKATEPMFADTVVPKRKPDQ